MTNSIGSVGSHARAGVETKAAAPTIVATVATERDPLLRIWRFIVPLPVTGYRSMNRPRKRCEGFRRYPLTNPCTSDAPRESTYPVVSPRLTRASLAWHTRTPLRMPALNVVRQQGMYFLSVHRMCRDW